MEPAFPNNLAIVSHKEAKPQLVFRNYKPISEECATASIVDQEASQQATSVHIEQVEAIERMYAKKMAKSLKMQSKLEQDPTQCLVADKKMQDCDLKRALEMKMVPLQVQTDRAILAMLKQKRQAN